MVFRPKDIECPRILSRLAVFNYLTPAAQAAAMNRETTDLPGK